MSQTLQRPSPTYVNMGLDGEMLLRLERPVRQELEKLYEDVYRELDVPGRDAPRPGLGKFIGFAAALGADEIRKRHLKGRGASAPVPAGRGAKRPARKRAPR